jgi:hypothetical protein
MSGRTGLTGHDLLSSADTRTHGAEVVAPSAPSVPETASRRRGVGGEVGGLRALLPLALAGMVGCDSSGAKHAPRCRELVNNAKTPAETTAALSSQFSGWTDVHVWTCIEVLTPRGATPAVLTRGAK